MKKQEMAIQFVDAWSEDEIVAPYRAGGWWKESMGSIRNRVVDSREFCVCCCG